MTNKQIFDIIYNGILEQGGPAINFEHEYIEYRSKNGRKCALGQLIPDEIYKPFFERWNVEEIPEVVEFFESKGYDLEFIKELQTIHDESVQSCDSEKSDDQFLSIFKRKMIDFAVTNKLM